MSKERENEEPALSRTVSVWTFTKAVQEGYGEYLEARLPPGVASAQLVFNMQPLRSDTTYILKIFRAGDSHETLYFQAEIKENGVSVRFAAMDQGPLHIKMESSNTGPNLSPGWILGFSQDGPKWIWYHGGAEQIIIDMDEDGGGSVRP